MQLAAGASVLRGQSTEKNILGLSFVASMF